MDLLIPSSPGGLPTLSLTISMQKRISNKWSCKTECLMTSRSLADSKNINKSVRYEKNSTSTYRAHEAMWMPMSVQSGDKVVHNRSATAAAFRRKMLEIILPDKYIRTAFSQTKLKLPLSLTSLRFMPYWYPPYLSLSLGRIIIWGLANVHHCCHGNLPAALVQTVTVSDCVEILFIRHLFNWPIFSGSSICLPKNLWELLMWEFFYDCMTSMSPNQQCQRTDVPSDNKSLILHEVISKVSDILKY